MFPMEEVLEKLKMFFIQFPEYLYLIIGLLAILFLIGFIKDKNWAIDTANGQQSFFYNWFGRKTFRIVGIMICLMAILGAVIAFIAYHYQ